METRDYLKYIVEEIHTTIVATVDDEGKPVTSAIDMMDYDEDGLYFLTAKGKNFYDRLVKREYLALTAIKGADTMSTVSISIRGAVRELGPDRLDQLFKKNPYMEQIYPTKSARQALTVFQIYEGNGEWFDLSKTPIERASFGIGALEEKTHGYFVGDLCVNCGSCIDVCPQQCIDVFSMPVIINQENCLRCGNCYEICPMEAIEKR